MNEVEKNIQRSKATYNANGSTDHNDGDDRSKDVDSRVPEGDPEVVGDKCLEVIHLCGLTGGLDDIHSLNFIMIVAVVVARGVW
jgi:hypothetical protein